jgi:hypothetical protein
MSMPDYLLNQKYPCIDKSKSSDLQYPRKVYLMHCQYTNLEKYKLAIYQDEWRRKCLLSEFR